ncbi:MAG: homoserine kinase [Gaiellaceae bacterium]
MEGRLTARAPATSANLGPGFDCAGVALDLWNELEVCEAAALEVEIEGEGLDEAPSDETHLGLRAFALAAPIQGKRFHFTNRIPFSRGLGSSSATIALGLAAASLWQGRDVDPAELLQLGMALESHADNLAACLYGGATLTWQEDGRWQARRVADELPLTPIAVIPASRVETASSRASLPGVVTHEDAAFSVGRAALLGAGLASGDPGLLEAAFHDRLHEPHRTETAPLLRALRHDLPAGAAGVTLSGSGPTVIVWTHPDRSRSCAEELRARFHDSDVRLLAIAGSGVEGST